MFAALFVVSLNGLLNDLNGSWKHHFTPIFYRCLAFLASVVMLCLAHTTWLHIRAWQQKSHPNSV
jgi:hypothetical protein